VSVLGVMRKAGAPKSLELVIGGESLFNDGIAVVLFALALGAATSGHLPSTFDAGVLLLQEAAGGIVFGMALGWSCFFLLRSIDSYHEEVLLTVATVAGGCALAEHLHVSPLLAMVVAGLTVGNQGRTHAMSGTTRLNMDLFWELLDEIFNAVLFVLIGFEVLEISFSLHLIFDALLVSVVIFRVRLLFAASRQTPFVNALACLPGRGRCSHGVGCAAELQWRSHCPCRREASVTLSSA
jgi:CPA1 family monovalent cation:H+ antiporter